ncbi:hypothetical protein AGR1B_Cc10402 [Agrobacterium fabacearum S56]|nr:hypothetical protein AGR1B_Cc10402 [Agrobacterium fabacearum S56]
MCVAMLYWMIIAVFIDMIKFLFIGYFY